MLRCHSGELYCTAGTLGQDAKAFRDAGDLVLSQTTVDAWGLLLGRLTRIPRPRTQQREDMQPRLMRSKRRVRGTLLAAMVRR